MEDIREKINKCMYLDRDNLTREYQQANSRQHDALQKKIESALTQKQSKIDALPSIVFPEILPVSAKREETPLVYLKSMPRYLDAIQKRLEKLSYSPEKDASKLAQIKPLWDEWMVLTEKNCASDNNSEELDEFHWMLEEFRVSLFAQELKTAMPVSQARLLKQLKNIRNN